MMTHTKWQGVKLAELPIAQWDDDCLLYNPLSGETHQLNLMAIDALTFFQQPATLPVLAQHICLLYQADNTDDIYQKMQQLIEQFDNLGLIEPCPT